MEEITEYYVIYKKASYCI